MSLHAIANHMASKGRNGDSMLVHMTPEEVSGLHALAVKHGGELTINPDTGLPEANFLKKLLPTIIGAGLTYFSGGMINPMMAAGIVGGVEAARTGDIGRGLSAGLGAYGGAGMTSSLAGAGANAMTTAGVGDYAKTLAARGLEAGTPEFGAAASELALNAQKEALAAPFADRLSAGFGAVTDNPAMAGTFLKDNAKNLMYAAGPAIMAGANVESKLPQTVTKPGMIRPYSFDPYGGRFTAYTPYEATPVKAAGGGLMGMNDGGYNPGDLDFAERSEPVVRMAAGGDYRSLTKDSSAEDIASAYKQAVAASGGDTKANQDIAVNYLTNLGIDQDRMAQAYTQFQASPTYTDYNYTPQNIVGYLQANPNIDIAAETARLNANPLLVNQAISQLGAGYLDPTQTTGGSGAFQYYDALTSAGIDANELYAANRALNPDYSGFSLDEMQRAFNVAKQFDTYQYDSAPGDQLAKDIAALRQYDLGGFGGDKSQQILDIARETGLSLDEATRRYDAARAAMKPGAITPGAIDEVGNLPGGVSGGISGGGNTVVNANGTITTTPDIPGRPEDGFTGMGQVKDVYTQGGGSLGYTPYVPTSIADFEAKYNRLGGGSKQAYDYLLGKGDYPTTPYTPTGELQKPYFESAGRFPTDIKTKRYLFQNGKYVENPDYVPPVYTQGAKSTGLSTNEVIKEFKALKPAETQANFDYVSYLKANPEVQSELDQGIANFGTKADPAAAAYNHYIKYGKGEGRPFTTTPNAMPDDATVFEWANTNNVSDAQLAEQMGISVAEVARRRKAFKDATTDKTVVDELTGQGGDASPAPPGEEAPDAFSMDGVVSTATGGLVPRRMAQGGLGALARGGMAQQYNLGDYSDGGRLLRGPGDGVSDSIPASIGNKRPARLADGEFVVPARIVSELGNGSTEAGARKLYAMMDRVQKARRKTTGKKRVATNTRADKYLPA